MVEEIQTHSKPVVEQCYRDFLLQNHDPEKREYPEATDQIREVLIHRNYLSQKDIGICLALDLAPLSAGANFPPVLLRHQFLVNRRSPARHDRVFGCSSSNRRKRTTTCRNYLTCPEITAAAVDQRSGNIFTVVSAARRRHLSGAPAYLVSTLKGHIEKHELRQKR